MMQVQPCVLSGKAMMTRIYSTLGIMLLVIHGVAQTPPEQTTIASDQLEQLREDYERSQVKENFIRYAAYTIIKPYLPVGTRFTSGFRSAVDQVQVIRSLAGKVGISSPPSSAGPKDEEAWGPALAALRAKGFIIASPLHTPHSSEDAVFDLAGADLGAINAAVEKARSLGLVKLKRPPIVEHRNNCVHVEVVDIAAKAIALLGRGSIIPSKAAPSSNGNGNLPGAAPITPLDEKKEYRQYLREQHDKEADPVRQIEIDRVRLKLEEETGSIKVLEEEIKEHEKKIQELSLQREKKSALENISAASQEGNQTRALEMARNYAERYATDETAQKQVEKLEALLLFDQATDIVIKGLWPCDECEEALNKVIEAIDKAARAQLRMQGAPKFKLELESHLRYCRNRTWLRYGLASLFGVALLVGVYFTFRPRRWMLKGVSGTCSGEAFPLDKEEIILGAVGPPDGEADIVISDAKRKISRSHCVIRQVGRKYYLKDKSANGTRVNGAVLPKDKYYQLRKGDEISLADVAEFTFRPE